MIGQPIRPTAVGDLPHQMQLINAGDDGLCGTSDDGDIRSIPADLPTQYVRNGTVPWRLGERLLKRSSTCRFSEIICSFASMLYLQKWESQCHYNHTIHCVLGCLSWFVLAVSHSKCHIGFFFGYHGQKLGSWWEPTWRVVLFTDRSLYHAISMVYICLNICHNNFPKYRFPGYYLPRSNTTRLVCYIYHP